MPLWLPWLHQWLRISLSTINWGAMTVVGEWFPRPGNPVWSKMETAYPQVARRYARDTAFDQAIAVHDHTLPCKDVLCISGLAGWAVPFRDFGLPGLKNASGLFPKRAANSNAFPPGTWSSCQPPSPVGSSQTRYLNWLKALYTTGGWLCGLRRRISVWTCWLAGTRSGSRAFWTMAPLLRKVRALRLPRLI